LSMMRVFINRAERDACLARALSSAGPIIITGERGTGRTTILGRALAHLAAGNDQVLRLLPSGEHRFAALRAIFPHRLPPPAALPDAVRAIAGYAGDRRLVVAVDDAHLVDHASLLALRELSRAGKAVLLVTRPLIAEPPARPDPSECLSYERGVLILILKPLSVGEVAEALAEIAGGSVSQATAEAVHAATGGNPQLLPSA
jgi:predicted ATPase